MPSLRARIINALLRYTVKPMWRPGLSIETVRAHAARTDARLARRPPTCETEVVAVGGLPAQWFGSPSLAERNGTLLYLHGGAWCLHLPALYARFAATLSRATGLRVLLVDYRLAPEHAYPAGIDDCLAVYRGLVELTGGAPQAMAGDSAGGSLSLVTLMRARDLGLPLPDCAVLLSPSTDVTFSGASFRYNAKADPLFNDATGDLLPDIYCPSQVRADPLLSPLFGDWGRLPPLYFLAGSTEMLLDDSVRAQDRAVQAGTQAVIDVWPEMPHVFPVFGFLPEARDAVARIAGFVRQHTQVRPTLGIAPNSAATNVAQTETVAAAQRTSP